MRCGPGTVDSGLLLNRLLLPDLSIAPPVSSGTNSARTTKPSTSLNPWFIGPSQFVREGSVPTTQGPLGLEGFTSNRLWGVVEAPGDTQHYGLCPGLESPPCP